MTTLSNLTRIRIGCVSLGQGPRPDLEDLHQRLLTGYGRSVELVWRHVLDGMTSQDIAAMSARDGQPAIRSVLRDAEPTWLDRDSFAPLVARAVKALEDEADVNLTIVCAAEELPTLQLHSIRPVILPARAMAAYAQVLAATRPNAHIGLVTYGVRQREQQLAGWAAFPWASELRMSFSSNGGDLEAAAADFAPDPPELIFVWAYGAGIRPGSPGPTILSARTGAPVILASAAAVGLAHVLLPQCEGSRA